MRRMHCMSNTCFGRHFSVNTSLVWAMTSSLQQINYHPRKLPGRDRTPECEQQNWPHSPCTSLYNLAICLTPVSFRGLITTWKLILSSSKSWFLNTKGIHTHNPSERIFVYCWPPINYTFLYISCTFYVFMHIGLFKALILMCWLKQLPCYSIIIPWEEPSHSHFICFSVGPFF